MLDRRDMTRGATMCAPAVLAGGSVAVAIDGAARRPEGLRKIRFPISHAARARDASLRRKSKFCLGHEPRGKGFAPPAFFGPCIFWLRRRQWPCRPGWILTGQPVQTTERT